MNYADITLGAEEMTMLAHISGVLRSFIETLFLVFENIGSDCPISALEANVPTVCYRKGLKVWMVFCLTLLWTKEPLDLPRLPNGRKNLFFCNCAVHSFTSELVSSLLQINTDIRFFSDNAIGILLLADSVFL